MAGERITIKKYTISYPTANVKEKSEAKI